MVSLREALKTPNSVCEGTLCVSFGQGQTSTQDMTGVSTMQTTGVEWGGRGVEWGGRGISLRGISLRGISLRGISLRGISLRGISLR